LTDKQSQEMKNATPGQACNVASALVAGITLLTYIGFKIYFRYGLNGYLFAVFPIIVFFSCYFIFFRIIRKFIYRKIKLIHKIIYDLKSPYKIKATEIQMNSNVIEDAEREVIRGQALCRPQEGGRQCARLRVQALLLGCFSLN